MNSDDDIEEEDMPLPKDATFEDIIDNASIEASKRDGQMIHGYVQELDKQKHNTIQMKELNDFMDHNRFRAAHFWKQQIKFYESKITTLFKELSKSEDVIRAAKRRMDYDTNEINRLREKTWDDKRFVTTTLTNTNKNALRISHRSCSTRERRQQH